jgi:hypothetical protein
MMLSLWAVKYVYMAISGDREDCVTADGRIVLSYYGMLVC